MRDAIAEYEDLNAGPRLKPSLPLNGSSHIVSE